MAHLKLPAVIILSAFLLLTCSCNNSTNNAKKNNAAQASVNDSYANGKFINCDTE